jgi:hypothetical protein
MMDNQKVGFFERFFVETEKNRLVIKKRIYKNEYCHVKWQPPVTLSEFNAYPQSCNGVRVNRPRHFLGTE